LLQVDEGRALVPFLRQQVEAEDLSVVKKDLAEIPDHALVDHRIAAAERSRISSGRLAKQIAREPHETLSFSSSTTTATSCMGKIDRQGQPNRTSADDHHRMAHRRCRILVGRALIRIQRNFEQFGHRFSSLLNVSICR
jgi:2-oxoglutarate dehydrogenase complex dehydrogenase (E1) component-like enzyme